MFYYEEINAYSEFLFDGMLCVINFVSLFASSVEFVCKVTFSNVTADKRISSTYITLFAVIGNFSASFPKSYTYPMVDYFDLFSVNAVGILFEVVVMVILIPKVQQVQQVPVQDWWMQDEKKPDKIE